MELESVVGRGLLGLCAAECEKGGQERAAGWE